METNISDFAEKKWRERILPETNISLETIEVFKNYILIKERVNGLIRYKKYNRNNGVTSIIPFKVHPATP